MGGQAWQLGRFGRLGRAATVATVITVSTVPAVACDDLTITTLEFTTWGGSHIGLVITVTGGTATKMAQEAAATKYHSLAAAVCAEDFMRAKDARTRLDKLKAAQWYERDDLVLAGGWATMPGENEGNGVVAELCATRLAEQAEAGAKATPVSAVAR